MEGLAAVLVFAGFFLMYEAYKNPSPTPLLTAQKAVTK